MKSALFTKTFLVISAMFFCTLTGYGQESVSAALMGKWIKTANGATMSFVFKSDNKWEVEFTGDDETDVYGSFVISEAKITFNDEGGQYSSDVPGTYEFKLSDTSLTFTKVDDPVEGRSMLLAGTWTKADAALKE